MKLKMLSIKFITDYNTRTLESVFDYEYKNKKIKVEKSSYREFYKDLINIDQNKNTRIRYIEIELSSLYKSISEKVIFNKNEIRTLRKNVLNLIDLIIKSENKFHLSIISIFKNYRNFKNINSIDFVDKIGRKSIEMEFNLILIKKLSKYKNIIIINPIDFLKSQSDIENEKYWYNTKSIYTLEETKKLSDSIFNVINNFFNIKKKLIICDLDNTLWGGILGDDGIEKIILGGHSAKGEAYKDFQKYLLHLKNNGILLALCSKNEKKIAINAITNHPEMILRLKDFVSVKINWVDKAENIKEILNDLNLNQEDVIFIDDSPSERGRVKSVFHKMLVLDLPTNPVLFPIIIKKLDCFNFDLTKEDKKRTIMYKQNSLREKNKIDFIKENSYQNWLDSLKIEVHIDMYSSINSTRILQLINKTNQMNISTNRYTPKDWDLLTSNSSVKIYSFKVRDKFGDYGLVGVLIIKKISNYLHIIDFILSCRVFGKNIEHTMLNFVNYICNIEKKEKYTTLFKKTNKNKPTLDFLNQSNYDLKLNNLYTWVKNNNSKFPNFIKIFFKKKILKNNKNKIKN